MEKSNQVAVFWDYDNCSVPSSFKSGYEIVKQIREVAQEFGSIKLLRAYSQLTEQALLSSRSSVLRSELQSSGVSITDCPQNGFKNVADQMIIVDMLTFAMDNLANSSSTTILIISGDKDFAYALSVLRLRMYNVVVVAPSTSHQSLRAQVSKFLDWSASILNGVSSREDLSPSNDNSTPATRTRCRPTTTSETANPSPGPAAPPINPIANDTPIPVIAPCPPHSCSHASSIPKGTTLPSPPPPPPSHSSLLPSHNSAPLPDAQSLQDIQSGHSNDRNMDTSPPGYSTERAEALPVLNPSPSYRVGVGMRDPSAIATTSLNRGTSDDVPSSATVGPVVNPQPALVQPGSVALPSRAPLPPFPRPRSAEPSFGAILPHTVLAAALLRQSGNAGTLGVSRQSSTSFTSDNPAEAINGSAIGEPDRWVFGDTTNGLSGGVRVSTTPAIPSRGLSQVPISISGTAPLPNPASAPPAKAPAAQSPASSTSTTSAAKSTSTPKASSVAPLTPPLKVVPHTFLPLVQYLEKSRLEGTSKPTRRAVARFFGADTDLYTRAGCLKFKDYISLALKLGFIQVGGKEESAWITLHPDRHGGTELEPGKS
ncbi:NYN domain-containing protein [Rhodocollybia butyracea]|uniref:NYN domain-containing protein n=1 Tax=Rhodocollybia butyracea TaxID=206335 RepID=A0A9P5U9X7_9AGAR|nr:NYN domain-containing protein [Rhodocollybia butyracea]